MEQRKNMQGMKGMSYKMFMLMMVISFGVMYLVMFLNMDSVTHYHTSLTRCYMALLMVAPMAVVMMLMMDKMYPDKRLNMSIIVGALVLFAVILAALRTQTPVGDVQYIKAMIPHHSSAIMVSKHAALKDPEVKQLSQQIIESQQREIDQMEAMLERLEH